MAFLNVILKRDWRRFNNFSCYFQTAEEYTEDFILKMHQEEQFDVDWKYSLEVREYDNPYAETKKILRKFIFPVKNKQIGEIKKII